MVVALRCFATFGGNPGPSRMPGTHRSSEMACLSRLSTSSCAPPPFGPPRTWGSAVAPALSPSAQPFFRGSGLRSLRPSLERRCPVHVTFATPQEDSQESNIDVGGVKDELRIKASESLEAWKQMLESFKKESIKMQSISQGAYEIYSKRAMVVLKETSEKMKAQADQARHGFNKLAKEVSEEGKEYLSTSAKNSPESMKDILEIFASSTDEVNDISEVRDFYLGIPYGGLLALGGFLHFMLTGSISAIRFGVILGCALLALSISSLRAWKNGQSSDLFLKGQAAIAAILFIREWNFIRQRLSLLSFLMTLIQWSHPCVLCLQIVNRWPEWRSKLGTNSRRLIRRRQA